MGPILTREYMRLLKEKNEEKHNEVMSRHHGFGRKSLRRSFKPRPEGFLQPYPSDFDLNRGRSLISSNKTMREFLRNDPKGFSKDILRVNSRVLKAELKKCTNSVQISSLLTYYFNYDSEVVEAAFCKFEDLPMLLDIDHKVAKKVVERRLVKGI
jgi:hypothetical protein